MAVSLFWRIYSAIKMSKRNLRRKCSVNYKLLNEESSDDDFAPALKKPRLSREERSQKKFEEQMKNTLKISKEAQKIDMSIVITNDYACEEEAESEDKDDSYAALDRETTPTEEDDSNEEDDRFEANQLLLKKIPKNTNREKKTKPKRRSKENIPKEEENQSVSIVKSGTAPTDTSSIEPLENITSSNKSMKMPYWKPPAIVGNERKSQAMTTGSKRSQVSGTSIRLGLSRKVRTKPLHHYVKLM